jgi:hypothetical protein
MLRSGQVIFADTRGKWLGNQWERYATCGDGTQHCRNPPNLTPSWGSANMLWTAAAALSSALATPADRPGYSNGLRCIDADNRHPRGLVAMKVRTVLPRGDLWR